MVTLRTVSKRDKILAIVLIVFIGLLNFHIPHFLIEHKQYASFGSYILEIVLLVNVLGAIASAVGIYRNMRWGWRLGVLIAVVSFILYVAQETIGLPGLPKMWLEPSRLVSLIVEILFVLLARSQATKNQSKLENSTSKNN